MIVITGATGYVGRQLLQHWPPGNDVVLVSRDPAATEIQGLGYPVQDYDGLRSMDLAHATFIHLAVRNNDRPGTLQEFRETNVDFLLDVAKIAKEGNARRFINICSTHALAPDASDSYGCSKREGAQKLQEYWPEGAVNLFLPAVYGNSFQGRLGALNRLPRFLKSPAVAVLKQIKPMISLNILAQVLQELAAAERLPGGRTNCEQFAADPMPAWGLYSAIKRSVDLGAGVLILLLGWPLFAVIAVCIRLDSKGPAFFLQKRVGQDGRIFTCYKFRTMSVGTGDLATHDVSAASVTKAGRILRRTKLDELPQAVNLLFNEMSLVGPRPCLPAQHELVSLRRERGVLAVKPGITGLAQINDIDMSDPSRLAAWDARYVKFRTTVSDILICVKTGLGGGAGDRTNTTQDPDGAKR